MEPAGRASRPLCRLPYSQPAQQAIQKLTGGEAYVYSEGSVLAHPAP